MKEGIMHNLKHEAFATMNDAAWERWNERYGIIVDVMIEAVDIEEVTDIRAYAFTKMTGLQAPDLLNDLNYSEAWETWDNEYGLVVDAMFKAIDTIIIGKMSRQRKWQIKKKREGMCPNCGKPKGATTIQCDVCRNQHKLKRELDPMV